MLYILTVLVPVDPRIGFRVQGLREDVARAQER